MIAPEDECLMTRRQLLFKSALSGAALLSAPARNLIAAAGGATALSDAEQEKFLLSAKVLRTRGLSEGVTNSVRATLSDGQLTHDAHVQSINVRQPIYQTALGTELNFQDTYRFNLAAYRLDRLVGLHRAPVSVERKVSGKSSSVTWWVDDVLMTEKERYQKGIEPPDPTAWNLQIYIVRVFDQLIYNMDRNLGNLIITKDWQLWMIDHTRAFRYFKDLKSIETLQETKCERHLLAGLRKLNQQDLKREIGSYLSGQQIDALLARRDKIVAFYEKRVAQEGEAAVLYDLPPMAGA
jgi:hypothetical protein